MNQMDDLSVSKPGHEDHWAPLSDLMTGLMMIFMLVAIVFMLQVKRNEERLVDTQARVKHIVDLYADLREQLYQDLAAEFKSDFSKWRASIRRDLSIRFEEPSIQFDMGSPIVKDGFKAVLDSFFPRYVQILRSPKYKDAIDEIRIEGHTSSVWRGLTHEQSYYENMRLSQERTRAVLMYIFSIDKVRDTELISWLLQRVTANGLSYARRIFLADGSEDVSGSQRVEFRVRTKAEDQLEKILKALSK